MKLGTSAQVKVMTGQNDRVKIVQDPQSLLNILTLQSQQLPYTFVKHNLPHPTKFFCKNNVLKSNTNKSSSYYFTSVVFHAKNIHTANVPSGIKQPFSKLSSAESVFSTQFILNVHSIFHSHELAFHF